jgi:hypothetical protein
VLLLCEVDLDKDDDPAAGYEECDVNEVFRLQQEQDRARKKSDKKTGRLVGELWGGEMEGSGEVLF